jgi:2,3-bisphosphoglycerate-independent phosphoglycerate mutase
MKYVVIIGDGMADRPIEELGHVTVLRKAATPHMDELARRGTIGSVRTIPRGFPAGSDVANLSILGYDPGRFYTGRAPLEAASMGITLEETDVAYRCNLVTLRREGDGRTVMDDYSSGHIGTGEARQLVAALGEKLNTEKITFYPGVSYRHLMVWKNGSAKPVCTPPHDILEREVTEFLPQGDGSMVLRDLMRRSVGVLECHPVSAERARQGKKAANSIWLWGQGSRPHLPTYQEKYRVSGALISAVDLTKGLGVYAGFKILDVPGVTGWLDTNYAGKAEYALEALEEVDFVYIHVEAPDEAGHSGNYRDKVRAIEDFDSFVVGRVMAGLKEKFPEYRILLMPDHATPVKVRTHTDEPVPYVIYDSRHEKYNEDARFDEDITQRPGIVVFEEGHRLMDCFIEEV